MLATAPASCGGLERNQRSTYWDGREVRLVGQERLLEFGDALSSRGVAFRRRMCLDFESEVADRRLQLCELSC
jgi:hypothetical protein